MGSEPLRSPLWLGSGFLLGQRTGFQDSLAQAWEWVWPGHSSGMCVGTFRARSREEIWRVCWVGCARLLPSSCTPLLCSLNRGQRDMQIPEETEAGDRRPGGWGRLGHGLVSCFWKRGNPGGFRRPLRAWSSSGLMSGDCGTQPHVSHP